MIKFAFVDDDDGATTNDAAANATRAEESAALELVEYQLRVHYDTGLRAAASGALPDARAAYERALSEPQLTAIESKLRQTAAGTVAPTAADTASAVAAVKHSGVAAAAYRSLLPIKYLILKNLADVCNKTGAKRDALTHWTAACELDGSSLAAADTYAWYHFGCVAFDCQKYPLARYALETGLKTAANHHNTMIVDKLLDVLYVSGDRLALSRLIDFSLRVDSTFSKAITLRTQLSYSATPDSSAAAATDSKSLAFGARSLALPATAASALMPSPPSLISPPAPAKSGLLSPLRAKRVREPVPDASAVPALIQRLEQFKRIRFEPTVVAAPQVPASSSSGVAAPVESIVAAAAASRLVRVWDCQSVAPRWNGLADIIIHAHNELRTGRASGVSPARVLSTPIVIDIARTTSITATAATVPSVATASTVDGTTPPAIHPQPSVSVAAAPPFEGTAAEKQPTIDESTVPQTLIQPSGVTAPANVIARNASGRSRAAASAAPAPAAAAGCDDSAAAADEYTLAHRFLSAGYRVNGPISVDAQYFELVTANRSSVVQRSISDTKSTSAGGGVGSAESVAAVAVSEFVSLYASQRDGVSRNSGIIDLAMQLLRQHARSPLPLELLGNRRLIELFEIVADQMASPTTDLFVLLFGAEVCVDLHSVAPLRRGKTANGQPHDLAEAKRLCDIIQMRLVSESLPPIGSATPRAWSIRYCWLLAQLAYCEEQLDTATRRLETLKTFLHAGEVVPLRHCETTQAISISTIDTRRVSIHLRQTAETARADLAAGSYDRVVAALKPIVFGTDPNTNETSREDRRKMLTIVQTACTKLGDSESMFLCHCALLTSAADSALEIVKESGASASARSKLTKEMIGVLKTVYDALIRAYSKPQPQPQSQPAPKTGTATAAAGLPQVHIDMKHSTPVAPQATSTTTTTTTVLALSLEDSQPAPDTSMPPPAPAVSPAPAATATAVAKSTAATASKLRRPQPVTVIPSDRLAQIKRDIALCICYTLKCGQKKALLNTAAATYFLACALQSLANPAAPDSPNAPSRSASQATVPQLPAPSILVAGTPSESPVNGKTHESPAAATSALNRVPSVVRAVSDATATAHVDSSQGWENAFTQFSQPSPLPSPTAKAATAPTAAAPATVVSAVASSPSPPRPETIAARTEREVELIRTGHQLVGGNTPCIGGSQTPHFCGLALTHLITRMPKPFSRSLCDEIGRCIACSYEHLTSIWPPHRAPGPVRGTPDAPKPARELIRKEAAKPNRNANEAKQLVLFLLMYLFPQSATGAGSAVNTQLSAVGGTASSSSSAAASASVTPPVVTPPSFGTAHFPSLCNPLHRDAILRLLKCIDDAFGARPRGSALDWDSADELAEIKSPGAVILVSKRKDASNDDDPEDADSSDGGDDSDVKMSRSRSRLERRTEAIARARRGEYESMTTSSTSTSASSTIKSRAGGRPVGPAPSPPVPGSIFPSRIAAAVDEYLTLSVLHATRDESYALSSFASSVQEIIEKAESGKNPPTPNTLQPLLYRLYALFAFAEFDSQTADPTDAWFAAASHGVSGGAAASASAASNAAAEKLNTFTRETLRPILRHHLCVQPYSAMSWYGLGLTYALFFHRASTALNEHVHAIDLQLALIAGLQTNGFPSLVHGIAGTVRMDAITTPKELTARGGSRHLLQSLLLNYVKARRCFLFADRILSSPSIVASDERQSAHVPDFHSRPVLKSLVIERLAVMSLRLSVALRGWRQSIKLAHARAGMLQSRASQASALTPASASASSGAGQLPAAIQQLEAVDEDLEHFQKSAKSQNLANSADEDVQFANSFQHLTKLVELCPSEYMPHFMLAKAAIECGKSTSVVIPHLERAASCAAAAFGLAATPQTATEGSGAAMSAAQNGMEIDSKSVAPAVSTPAPGALQSLWSPLAYPSVRERVWMCYNLHAQRLAALLAAVPPTGDGLLVLRRTAFEDSPLSRAIGATPPAARPQFTVERFNLVASSYHALESARLGIESVVPPQLLRAGSTGSAGDSSPRSGDAVRKSLLRSFQTTTAASASPIPVDSAPSSPSTTTSAAPLSQSTLFSVPVLSQSVLAGESAAAAPALARVTSEDDKSDAVIGTRLSILNDIAVAMRACVVTDPTCYPAAIRLGLLSLSGSAEEREFAKSALRPFVVDVKLKSFLVASGDRKKRVWATPDSPQFANPVSFANDVRPTAGSTPATAAGSAGPMSGRSYAQFEEFRSSIVWRCTTPQHEYLLCFHVWLELVSCSASFSDALKAIHTVRELTLNPFFAVDKPTRPPSAHAVTRLFIYATHVLRTLDRALTLGTSTAAAAPAAAPAAAGSLSLTPAETRNLYLDAAWALGFCAMVQVPVFALLLKSHRLAVRVDGSTGGALTASAAAAANEAMNDESDDSALLSPKLSRSASAASVVPSLSVSVSTHTASAAHTFNWSRAIAAATTSLPTIVNGALTSPAPASASGESELRLMAATAAALEWLQSRRRATNAGKGQPPAIERTRDVLNAAAVQFATTPCTTAAAGAAATPNLAIARSAAGAPSTPVVSTPNRSRLKLRKTPVVPAATPAATAATVATASTTEAMSDSFVPATQT